VKRPVPAEVDNAAVVRRSWHAARDLARGSRLTDQDVALLRPASGVPPSTDLAGRTVVRDVAVGEPIVAADLDGSAP
jgi:N-acetylneuraminate synthase/N,N'-diacetyllegionaminate synthase